MKIGLIDVDSKIANLALMKISAWHKKKGDTVIWYSIFEQFDIVYISKIFTFTPDYFQVITNAKKVIRGGTGYGTDNKLEEDIDRTQPDYTIYPEWDKKTALGFLTRGCPNKCVWCIVPHKEGFIVPYMDIKEVTQGYKFKRAVLLDNNILGIRDYAIEQIKKIIENDIRIDFNQAMDARLVDEEIAILLSKCKWIDNRIRFGCDTQPQIKHCERVIMLLRNLGFNGEFLLYTIIKGEIEECYDRISRWKKIPGVKCQSQPLRNLNGKTVIPKWQMDMARWSNQKALYMSCDFKDYEPRKGFKCIQYFKND